MEAHATEQFESYLPGRPALVVGDSDEALRRALRTVEASGTRIGASLRIEGAADRLAVQAAASVVWLELERAWGPAHDRVLQQVLNDVRDGRFPAVVSARGSLLDSVFSRTRDAPIELVINGSESDRAAALAIATSGIYRADRLCDVTADRSSERLRQLSDEVSRIASTLARLSIGPSLPQQPRPAAASDEIPRISSETVRQVIRARRLRANFFESDLFADPAWDMLLDLFQAEISQLRVPVSSLCIAAAVPPTTALRWIKTMTDKGIFVRRSDPRDARRVFVELSEDASIAMRRYFSEMTSAIAA
jgi:DNA-binding MarR family transcriptional regulator